MCVWCVWCVCVCVCVCVCRTVCTVPLIDYIDGNEYSMEPQQGGDEDGLARGAWDWSLLWKRVPLSQREKSKRKHTTEPYRYTHSSQHANTYPCFFCVSISHPSIPPVLSPAVSHSVLVFQTSPHVVVFSLALLSVFACVFFPACAQPLHIFPPMYLVCMVPPPLCQNGVYGASDRLHPRPEVHHRASGWRRQGRLC